MSMKNPLTLAGIEPAPFRFVAQQLNHCAIAVPSSKTHYNFNNEAARSSETTVTLPIEITHPTRI